MRIFTVNSLKALGLAALMSAMISMPAFANVGRVLYTFGAVTVEKPAISVLRRGGNIEEGDVIVTGPKGYAQIKLADGTKIAIRPESRFVIEALEAPATATTPAIGAGTALRASFNLQKGGFRTITGGIAKRDPTAYRVSTPSAVISVRGTNYMARICSANCGGGTDDGLYVGVSDGAVSLSNGAGSLNLSNDQFGFAANFNTPPARLIAPPTSLQDDGLGVLEGAAEEESGDEGSGSSEPSGSETSGDESGSESEGDSASSVASSRSGAVSTKATTTAAGGTTTTTKTGPDEGDLDREIIAVGSDGQPVDLTGGEETSVPRGLAFVVAGRAIGVNANGETFTFDEDNNLAGFDDVASEGLPTSYALGDAVNRNVGFDPVSAIKWGRWGGGVATQSTAGEVTNLDLNNESLHWVSIDQDEVIPTQAITGSASYTLVGNTDPTDNLGNVGILGSASLSADFTNATVQSSLQLGINSQNWTATGSGAITTNIFNGLYGTVSVDGDVGATGSFGGAFGGFGTSGVPTGAGMTYQLSNGTATVSGAAVFNNAGNAQ
ncbi:MAG: hypothetical protein ACJAXW_003218 [Candidatus Azotimanducaceae bacterium]|jgi:hypothetical protein